MARVLVVEDDAGFREFVADVLQLAGHEVHEAVDGADARRKLVAAPYQVVLTDVMMARMDGMALLGYIKREAIDTQVVVMTAHGSVPSAVEAMRVGAFDYLEKPFESPEQLADVVARAASAAPPIMMEGVSAEGVVGLTWGAPAMAAVMEALRRVARTQATVMLLGESGVGKEVAARTLHQWSGRGDKPFIAVNCAAFSDALLESELFGHEKGAFTGAVNQRKGRLELAQGGTFFLDEVGELKPDLQARLLRVLQERAFERVGGSRLVQIDVRFVAATNRDLGAMVREGGFREDLYHRLAVFPIRIPPLRERREDILPLAAHLLQRTARELDLPGLTFSEELREWLPRQPWPGNVRELANLIERAAILSDGKTLRLHTSMLPTEIHPTQESAAQLLSIAEDEGLRTMDEVERETIRRALEQVGGNRRRAAGALGIGLRTLYTKLKKYQMDT